MNPYNATFDRLLTSTYRSVLRVEAAMLRSLSGSDLSISEMHVLESIGKGPGGSTITDIAQDQGITLPSVTTQVQRLVRKGYAVKDRSPRDARCVRVALTEKGRRAEVAHRYFHRQMVKAVTGGMPADERDALLRGLSKLDAFLRARADEGGANVEGGGEG